MLELSCELNQKKQEDRYEELKKNHIIAADGSDGSRTACSAWRECTGSKENEGAAKQEDSNIRGR